MTKDLTVLAAQSSYDCHAFHESLKGGKSSGTLAISASGLKFNIQGKTVSLPFERLEIKMGGASNRLVFFSHPAFPDWSFYSSDRKVLKDPQLKQHNALARHVKRATNVRKKAWAVFWAVCLLIIAIPALLLLRMDILTKYVAAKIPAQWEESLGESAMAQYRIGQQLMPEDEANEILQPLLEPLMANLASDRYQYEFHIVNDSSVNAFALPGGQVVINSALILTAESAPELLGVVAHEISHVQEQHGVRNVIGSAGTFLVVSALVGDASGLIATLSGAAPLLLNQSYSRRFETEADVKGFGLLVDANIDPQGLTNFFERLMLEEQKQLESIDNEDARNALEAVTALLSTHPTNDARIQRLNKLTAELASNREFLDLSREFSQLQSLVKQFVTENNEEELLRE
ncbi:M48 family metallopeptidase [Reinekea marinisedimentorum]|uniref:Peptidase M48-like protein n=1 Tax=Reinekea marinisedimentorum TaxID=230495 RepID=A0A4R3HZ32_9GAMM|nr:M48 family metallopeptidase [Reinekea marinisedimentorum]TCS37591.1 peptidase M48-like protein [Reinekea marinisedimentorum]